MPSEHASGASRSQGPITKAGNTHARRLLVEAAWHHRPRYRPKTMRERWDLDTLAAWVRGEAGNRRLHARWASHVRDDLCRQAQERVDLTDCPLGVQLRHEDILPRYADSKECRRRVSRTLMSNRHKPKRSSPDPASRRAEAEALIDKVLHGTPEGRVDPAIAENLRQHLARKPGQPDRALLNHFKDQIPDFDAAFPEDLEK